MLHASTQKLIIKLYELTESGAIAWKDGSGHRALFETEGYRVEIEPHPPGVYLLDTEGRELEHAGEADLAAVPWPDGNGTFATRVDDMARRAKRVARGAEQAITRILSSLSAPPRNAEPALSGFEQPPPPPAPHSMPGPAPVHHAAEDDNAIERILAVQAPPPRPMEEPVAEPEPRIAVEESAAPAEVFLTPEPEPQLVSAAAVELTEEASPEIEPEPPAPETPPAVEQSPLPPARSSFGATSSFDRSKAPAAPQPAPQPIVHPPESAAAPAPRRYSANTLFMGISARTHQTSKGELAPAATLPPQTPPAVEKAPERKLEPANSAADVYKPWT